MFSARISSLIIACLLPLVLSSSDRFESFVRSHDPRSALTNSIEPSRVIPEGLLDQIGANLEQTCGSSCELAFRRLIPLVNSFASSSSSGVNGTFTPLDGAGRSKLGAREEIGRIKTLLSTFLNTAQPAYDGLLKQLREADESGADLIKWPGDETSEPVVSSFPKTETSSASPSSAASAAALAPLNADYLFSTGLPCSDEEGCKKIDFAINRCTYMRQSVMSMYAGQAALANGLDMVIAALCGCLFIGDMTPCVLQGIPYTCKFPYGAFEGIFQLSGTLWGIVKLTTKLCNVVGPPILASPP